MNCLVDHSQESTAFSDHQLCRGALAGSDVDKGFELLPDKDVNAVGCPQRLLPSSFWMEPIGSKPIGYSINYPNIGRGQGRGLILGDVLKLETPVPWAAQSIFQSRTKAQTSPAK